MTKRRIRKIYRPNNNLHIHDVGRSEELVCDCPDEKLWDIKGKIVCECGKYHKNKAN